MINLRYSIPEAQNTSRMGVPVALHVYGISGAMLRKGQVSQLNSGSVLRVFTGISVTIPPNMIGLITPVEEVSNPRVTLLKGVIVLPPGFSGDINFEITSVGAMSLIEVGLKVAELYFVEVKT